MFDKPTCVQVEFYVCTGGVLRVKPADSKHRLPEGKRCLLIIYPPF